MNGGIVKYGGKSPARHAPPAHPALPANAAIDLHLHSSYSDGSDRPADLARRAKEIGLDVIALADHDTIRGLPEAREACLKLGITFVPGIELGVGLGADEIHILGYGIDAKSRSIQRTLDLLAGERFQRMEHMVSALQKLGIEITIDDVQAVAKSDILSRLHLATALVSKGLVDDQNEAFRRWLGAGKPAYVHRTLLTLRDAIDLIQEAGGVAVMAHPGLTRRDELIEYLVKLGVRGLEIYYPKHDFADVARYQKKCARFDLFATGGSDYHGSGKPDVVLGASKTPLVEYEKMLKYIRL